MEQKEITKTRLIIYVLLAYGLTCLMGILMWYGSMAVQRVMTLRYFRQHR